MLKGPISQKERSPLLTEGEKKGKKEKERASYLLPGSSPFSGKKLQTLYNKGSSNNLPEVQ